MSDIVTERPAEAPLARGAWIGFLAVGVALMVLGIFAISSMALTTRVLMKVLGWLMIIGGGFAGLHAVFVHRWHAFAHHLLGAVLLLVVGVLLASHPGASAIALTLLLAAYFLVAGLFRIISASAPDTRGRGWLMLNGIVELVLGFVLFAGWPVSGLWALGLFVGIDLLLDGAWLASAAVAARRLGLAARAAT